MHILRHEVACFLLIECNKRLVAERAAGEGAESFDDLECLEYLFQLVLNMVTLDKQVVCCKGPCDKVVVAGEDDAVLFKGQADDLIVGEGPVVEDIEPQEPQALCKTAQHDIGDELHKNLTACHEGTKARRKAYDS